MSSSSSSSSSSLSFLNNNEEDGDYNQYWYSPNTIDRIVEDVINLYNSDNNNNDKVLIFLSTPSLYFSLPDYIMKNSYVFDYDKKWSNDRGFVFYDFNNPSSIPNNLLGKADYIIIDPPFITRDVWEKYTETAKLLIKNGNDSTGQPYGKIVCTTVYENAMMLDELLGVKPTAFLPSIPHLVYQYNLYTNYNSDVYSKKNPEIPE